MEMEMTTMLVLVLLLLLRRRPQRCGCGHRGGCWRSCGRSLRWVRRVRMSVIEDLHRLCPSLSLTLSHTSPLSFVWTCTIVADDGAFHGLRDEVRAMVEAEAAQQQGHATKDGYVSGLIVYVGMA